MSLLRSASGLSPSTAASADGTFFLYGLSATDPSTPARAVIGGSSLSLVSLAGGLAALPQKTPDDKIIALISIGGDPVPTVTVTCVDAGTGTAVQSGTLALPAVSMDSTLLITPTFASDSRTLCLVLSVTVPSGSTMLPKVDPNTGQASMVASTRWVSQHALAYFDTPTGTFLGPFYQSDGPSLARVNLAANSADLFVWSMDYPEPASAQMILKPSIAPPPTIPRLSIYPLGTGTPRLVVDAPGPWPVNGEPAVPLSSGDIIRMVYGTTLESNPAIGGAATTVTVPALDRVSARPSAPTLELRADGRIFVSAPAVGSAALVDPAAGFTTVGRVDYGEPLYSRGGPSSKALLAPDGQTLVVLGDRGSGGIAGYNFTSGTQIGEFTDGRHFSAVHRLGNGNLLAVEPNGPTLYLFAPDLGLIETRACDIHVAAIL